MMGASWPFDSEVSQTFHLPPRLLRKASFLPSRDRIGRQASTPGEVTAWPAPTICPRVASNGSIHARIWEDPPVKAIFLPSGDRDNSVSNPVPVVMGSIAVARKV